MAEPKHVVILGAGFGGIGALKKLRDADVRITIVDKRDYHTFQPLLYQVATDELGPTEVGFPIRELLHSHKNITYHQVVVKSVDLAKKQVVTDGAAAIQYDYLVLGLGAVVNFFHTPGADQYALPLYTMEDAIRLKEHILKTFEAVDKNPAQASAWTMLSHLLINKGQLAEAKLAAENAYKADPYLTDVDKTILRHGLVLIGNFDRHDVTGEAREIGEERLRVLVGHHAHDHHQRTRHPLLEIAERCRRDPATFGIVAAVEPDFTARRAKRNQLARGQALHPPRPFGIGDAFERGLAEL